MYQPIAQPVLNREEAEAKRAELLPMVLDTVKQVSELDGGYVLRFTPEEEEFALILDWIKVERNVNPFLKLDLTAESNTGPIKVGMSGPSGTKDFLVSELGLNRWL